MKGPSKATHPIHRPPEGEEVGALAGSWQCGKAERKGNIMG